MLSGGCQRRVGLQSCSECIRNLAVVLGGRQKKREVSKKDLTEKGSSKIGIPGRTEKWASGYDQHWHCRERVKHKKTGKSSLLGREQTLLGTRSLQERTSRTRDSSSRVRVGS